MSVTRNLLLPLQFATHNAQAATNIDRWADIAQMHSEVFGSFCTAPQKSIGTGTVHSNAQRRRLRSLSLMFFRGFRAASGPPGLYGSATRDAVVQTELVQPPHCTLCTCGGSPDKLVSATSAAPSVARPPLLQEPPFPVIPTLLTCIDAALHPVDI